MTRAKKFHGLEKLANWQQGFVFHAGTAKENNRWLTTGGRVLGVTARGKSVAEAVKEVYRAVGEISWAGHALSQRHCPPGVDRRPRLT